MQFNSHATNQDLVSDIKFWLTGSATGTIDYGINDITRNVNKWYDREVSLIMMADGRWEFDDNNHATLPIGTTDLVAEQADYEITASSFLDILRVEIKDSDGNGVFLHPISYADKTGVAMTEWMKTSGTPQYYDKVGNSIILYPTPNYASAAGLKVYFKRNVSHFVVTDTTKEPGFNPLYHRLLSIGASSDYCIPNGLTQRLKTLESEIIKTETAMVGYYSSRSKDDHPRISLRKENIIIGKNAVGGGGEKSINF